MRTHLAAAATPYAVASQALAMVGVAVWPCLATTLAVLASDLAAVASVVAYCLHARRLCEYCVAYLPPDPDAAVGRRRLGLLWCHLALRRKLAVAVLAGSVAVIVLTDSAVTLLVLAACSAFYAADVRADYWHRRLQPWCPWCHHPGEGDPADAPDPRLTELLTP